MEIKSMKSVAERPCESVNGDARVGILNLQNIDNYGAVLLCLALQKKIEDMGYNPCVIDYRPDEEKNPDSIVERVILKLRKEGIYGVAKALICKLAKRAKVHVNVSSGLKKRRFEAFREEYLHRTELCSGEELAKISPFRAYVVGSDVIWKPERVESAESNAYFLRFTQGRSCNRIAYAASVGTRDAERLAKIKLKFSEYVQPFDHISVREPSTVPFVQELVSTKVENCVDPTLLQSAEFYHQIASKTENTSSQKYIYFYMFDDENAGYDYVNRCSKQLGLPVICQCNKPKRIKNLLLYSGDDGPAEFLNRIQNAEYIITNSFHGTIFSILFHKNFATISRNNLDFRVQSLLEALGLSERFVEQIDSAGVLEPISDYSTVENKLELLKEKSIKYLKDALKNTKEA